jgi:hypothetical protein
MFRKLMRNVYTDKKQNNVNHKKLATAIVGRRTSNTKQAVPNKKYTHEYQSTQPVYQTTTTHTVPNNNPHVPVPIGFAKRRRAVLVHLMVFKTTFLPSHGLFVGHHPVGRQTQPPFHLSNQ